ncbi:hypothetical protein X798_05546 [Onchocerca flexuosa]|uniref:Uncharacterized protein n=1 Tax=Onchocerca flexuosa TaxID=387005 RepID=A0A238BPU9_9BILA|nr:hypothetical protein X798_05546 [Onchocerca flexuosa]
MVGTRKCKSRKSLKKKKKWKMARHIIDSILERIQYLVNNECEKLEKGQWGKPDKLLGVEGIADLIIRNFIKQLPGEIVMEIETGIVTGAIKKN